MDGFLCWNIRGLNEPSKQFSIRNLLASNKVSLAGMLETKVRDENKDRVLAGIGNFTCISNSTQN